MFAPFSDSNWIKFKNSVNVFFPPFNLPLAAYTRSALWERGAARSLRFTTVILFEISVKSREAAWDTISHTDYFSATVYFQYLFCDTIVFIMLLYNRFYFKGTVRLLLAVASTRSLEPRYPCYHFYPK